MPKRSLSLKGHRTSVSLEEEFWEELKRLAQEEKSSLNALVSRIDAQRAGNLSSALRVYVLRRLKQMSFAPISWTDNKTPVRKNVPD